MVLIEVFLPTFDNDGNRFSKQTFDSVRSELAEKFGGVTAFTRSPATGLWSDGSGQVHQDEILIFEVMTDSLDQAWWASYRNQLEKRLRQDELLIRVTECRRI